MSPNEDQCSRASPVPLCETDMVSSDCQLHCTDKAPPRITRGNEVCAHTQKGKGRRRREGKRKIN
jgi:hypothetical protein